jgi:SAM-dependent methyltransferase
MKDVVENRSRISFRSKVGLGWVALRENGIRWSILLVTYYAASHLANRTFAAMDQLRRIRNLPGLNSAALNKKIWESWNWEAGGEEWNGSDASKMSVVSCVLRPLVPSNSRIVEIGPGGGRWTEYLLERAKNYIGIDISSTCVAHCEKRFAHDSHARFDVGSGRDLRGVENASVDVIWSVDVFVHINLAEAESYAREFVRVLVPGGVAVIHHGAVGGSSGGWRSNMTSSDFHAALSQSGLSIEKSFNDWMENGVSHQLSYGDLITVIRK